MTLGAVPFGKGTFGAGASGAILEEFAQSAISMAASWGTATGFKRVAAAEGDLASAAHTFAAKTTRRRQDAVSTDLTFGQGSFSLGNEALAATVGLNYLSAAGHKVASTSGILSDLSYGVATYEVTMPPLFTGDARSWGVSYLLAEGVKRGVGSAKLSSVQSGSAQSSVTRFGSADLSSAAWSVGSAKKKFSGIAGSASAGWIFAVGDNKELFSGSIQGFGYTSAAGSKRSSGAGASVGLGVSSAGGKKALRVAIQTAAFSFLESNGIKHANGAGIFWSITETHGRIGQGRPVPIFIEIFVLGKSFSVHTLEVAIDVDTLHEKISFQSVDAITRKV